MVLRIIIGMCAILVFSNVRGETTLAIGHYFVEASDQEYQFTSFSGKVRTKEWAAKASIPYIQKSAPDADQGIGNVLLKISRKWRWPYSAITLHAKKKLNNADSNVTTPVSDQSLSAEWNHIFRRGVFFAEAGYWWRENKTYKRDDTWYGAIGYLKPFQNYTLAIIADHKPTALGEEDSVFSIMMKKKIADQLAISVLIGTGLRNNSPDHLTGIQLSKSIH